MSVNMPMHNFNPIADGMLGLRFNVSVTTQHGLLTSVHVLVELDPGFRLEKDQ